MLVELDIQNFAIIKSLKVRFQEKMTALIGETGAGKSIIIDAVSLLLGSRAQSEMIRTGESKAIVTGLFAIDQPKTYIKDICKDFGLPFDDNQLVISREISVKGRNVVRINGQLTTINVLKRLGKNLVDIHGQNDNQILMDQDRQIDLVDDYASSQFKKKLADYQDNYRQWQKLTKRLHQLREDAQQLAQKQDILEFQNKELTEAELEDPQEDEKLEEEFNGLNNYQKIADTANYLMQLYDDEEHGLASLLGQAQSAADDLAEYGKKFQNFAQSFTDGVYSLNDARSELGDLMDAMDFDQERYQYVLDRISTLNNLKKKYGPTLADVFTFYAKVQKELKQFNTGGLDEDQIQTEIAQLEKTMTAQSQELSSQRRKIARQLESQIKQELTDLYMEKARFAIDISPAKTFNKLGMDEVIFMIAPNPGEALRPLVKIASGGEQSRLVLALKTIFSRVEVAQTMIFDEIDTGVSGRVSAAIGQKMKTIGKHKQVITITHSPQVAAAADHCYSVMKEVEDGATFTQIKPLDYDGTVEAIAKMMAGQDITAAAKQNAIDLIASFNQE